MFLNELILINGGENVSTSISDKVSYARDAYPLTYKWINQGEIKYPPDYIAWPKNNEELIEIIQLCNRYQIPFTPFGGGSGIVGGALSIHGGLIIDMKKLNSILDINEKDRTVTVETGIIGQEFEEQLNKRGFTCGHYPQSIRQSTVGGWIAHRGVGTYSTKYGKIDDMVVSMKVIMPTGELVTTRNVPKSATGPNLNELFIGSEGTLGVVTEVTMKIHPLPEKEEFLAYSFDNLDQGMECIRKVIHRDMNPAVVRLYDATEAKHHFSDLGIKGNSSVLLFGMTGFQELVELESKMINDIAVLEGGKELGSTIGEKWLERRFSTAGLCNTIREKGGIADALEVTGSWSQLYQIYKGMKTGMEKVIGDAGEVFGHISHVYPSGGNLYMIFKANFENEDKAEQLYYEILSAAFTACLKEGGTLSHHHGVGIGKAKWMRTELGENGFELLKKIKDAVDPQGLMNKGKLGL